MKTLIVLQGIPGSGKSTFIEENGLAEYTLCPDTLRLMFSSLQMGEEDMEIDQKVNNKVFPLLETLLDTRMEAGAFTVVDATHCSAKSLDMYKKLIKKHHYRMVLITFDVSLDECIKRNQSRGYKAVPPQVLTRMHNNLQAFTYENWYKIATPENWKSFACQQFDVLDRYEKVIHVGDIHGSIVPLKKIEIVPENFYIFMGDYIDRGTQNGKTMKYIMELATKPNVILLKGNHELHIDTYLSTGKCKTRDFAKSMEQIIAEGITNAELKSFTSKLRDVYTYTYYGKTVICNHGGIPFMPKDIRFINPMQYIKGVSDYDFNVDKAWSENTPNVFQVHGHRNKIGVAADEYPYSFNLNSAIERGEALRILTLSANGSKVSEIDNPDFLSSDDLMFAKLSEDPDIITKEQSGVVSFNFTRETFWEKRWTANTIQARGLFCNGETHKVVARGYEKFFSVGETMMTSLAAIERLSYPLNAYVKENGFLGLLGVHNNELMFASKSSITSDFAKWFKEIFEMSADSDAVLKYLQENNACMVFEVVDNINDPHIINYDGERKIVLLDVLKRDYNFSKISYAELVKVAKDFNLPCKELAYSFADFDSLKEFLEDTESYDYLYHGKKIEGFVFEDQSDSVFHFKLKSGYYKFWKAIRGYYENKTISPDNRKIRLFKMLAENNLHSQIPLAEKILLKFPESIGLFEMQMAIE